MQQDADSKIRKQLVKHIKGGEAFMPLQNILEIASFDKIHIVPEKLPYSFYQLFFHMHHAQQDIIEFTIRPESYESSKWPDNYWPESKGPESEKEWEKLQKDFFRQREEFCDYLSDPENSLLAPFSHGSGQTLMREAELIIEHNAYHIGQLLVILRLLSLYE